MADLLVDEMEMRVEVLEMVYKFSVTSTFSRSRPAYQYPIRTYSGFCTQGTIGISHSTCRELETSWTTDSRNMLSC